jgi:glycolate dehydrogenase FAD-binding subunit
MRTASTLSAAAAAAVRDACAHTRDAEAADAVDGVLPALVASPESTAQTSAVLRAAAAHDLAVVPRGGGTKLTWGRPPTAVDLVVDVSRMNQVVDHAAGDLIAVTQAGVRLADFQQVVASAGQRLAVDETVPGASVGGTITTAASGPSRLLAGTVRDLLIGVTIVRADGVTGKAGGRVVKNVAGYDIGKLVTGSFGTLGVVTEAIVRLHPLPAARQVVTATVDDPAHAHRLVQSIIHAQVVPTAVEIDWPASGSGRVAVLLEGTDAGVDSRAARTLSLLGGSAAISDHTPGWWAAYPWASGETGLKLTFALSGLQTALDRVGQLRESEGVEVAVRGSAGAGVLYGAIRSRTGSDAGASDTPSQVVGRVVERLRTTCAEFGGSLVVVDAPADVKEAVDVWGPIPAIDLMRRVKHQFDPSHRLSPGRFVGGI